MVDVSTLPLVGKLIGFFQANGDSRRKAAITLCDATRELQWAVWEWVALHSQSKLHQQQRTVAKGAREFLHEEEKILDIFGSAYRVFTEDYYLPHTLAMSVQRETTRINHNLTSLKSLSVSGKCSNLSQAAFEVQRACERIRRAATPHLRMAS